MASVDTRTEPGDIYFLEPNVALLYGIEGIALKLNARNLANVARAHKTHEVIRDADAKQRRFNVRFDNILREIVFEPAKGDPIRSPEWMIFEPDRIAA